MKEQNNTNLFLKKLLFIKQKMNIVSIINDSSKGLFLIFLAIICNYLGQVMNCSVQKALTHSLFFKWLFVFILIFFTVNFTSNPKENPFVIVANAFFIFVCFILFMKQNIATLTFSFLLLISMFLLNQWITYYKNHDPKLHEKKIQQLEKACLGLQITLFIVLIIGTGLYYKQQIEDKTRSFEWTLFFFGATDCSALKNIQQN